MRRELLDEHARARDSFPLSDAPQFLLHEAKISQSQQPTCRAMWAPSQGSEAGEYTCLHNALYRLSIWEKVDLDEGVYQIVEFVDQHGLI